MPDEPQKTCSHPHDKCVVRWQRDPHMPAAEVLTVVCGQCGAVLPGPALDDAPVRLVDVRPHEDTPASE